MERDINLRIITQDLPGSISALTASEGNDRYTVMINGKADQEDQIAGFLHECLHIWHNDFENSQDVNDLEILRHSEMMRILSAQIRSNADLIRMRSERNREVYIRGSCVSQMS